MLSVIIPIGGEDKKGRRRRNLIEELYCIGKQAYRDYEVILVEQVQEKPIYDDFDVDKYIPIKKSRGFFNLPWGRNVGARSADGDIHLHIDADLIFDEEYFGKVVDFGKEAFSAWSTMCRLSEKGFQEWLRSRSFDVLQMGTSFTGKGRLKDESLVDMREGRQLHPNIWHGAGAAYCFDRDFFFNRFGGFNENFYGWGGDDNDATLRFSRIFDRDHQKNRPYYVLPDCTIYHLPHGGRRVASKGVPGGGKQWDLMKRDPMGVTEKLLKANLGKRERPTVIK